MPVERVVIELVGDSKKLTSTIDQLKQMGVVDEKNARQFEKNNKKFNEGVKKSGKGLDGLTATVGQLGAALAGAITVGAIVNLGKQVLNTRAEFQKLEAVLANTLGSRSAAASALRGIQQFAAQTPFQVKELTDAFVKLTNQGFKPSLQQMRSLGDLASSTGKSFNQLAEAILDAQTGEFERLKEFGIKAKTEGDRVKFTFKGVTTEVNKTADAMREYILSLGDAEGVTGSMAVISETLSGKISNLGDSWDMFLNALGGQTQGVFSDVISGMSEILKVATEVAKGTEKMQEDIRGSLATGSVALLLKGIDSPTKRLDVLNKELATMEKLLKTDLAEIDVPSVYNDLNEALEDLQLNGEGMREELRKNIEQNEGFIRVRQAHIQAIKDTIIETKKAAAAEAARLKALELEKNTLVGLRKELQTQKKAFETAQIGSEAYVQASLNMEEIQSRINDLLSKSKDAWAQLQDEIKKITKEMQLQALAGEVNNDTIEDYIQLTQLATEATNRFKEAIRQATIERLTREAGEPQTMPIIQPTGVTSDTLEPLKDLFTQAKEEYSNDKKAFIEEQEEKIAAIQGVNNAMQVSMGIFQNIAQTQINALETQKQHELDTFGTTAEKKAAIEDKFNKKITQIRRQQAVANKAAAAFEITINTAAAIIRMLADPGGIPGVALSALAGATGAAQLAAVLSAPLPKFHKGRDPQASGYGTSIGPNEQLSITRKDEYIMNPEESRRYSKPLKLMKDGRFEKMYEQKLDRTWNNKGSFAENVAAYDGANVVNAINSQTKKGRQDAKMLASKFDKYADPDNLYGW